MMSFSSRALDKYWSAISSSSGGEVACPGTLPTSALIILTVVFMKKTLLLVAYYMATAFNYVFGAVRI